MKNARLKIWLLISFISIVLFANTTFNYIKIKDNEKTISKIHTTNLIFKILQDYHLLTHEVEEKQVEYLLLKSDLLKNYIIKAKTLEAIQIDSIRSLLTKNNLFDIYVLNPFSVLNKSKLDFYNFVKTGLNLEDWITANKQNTLANFEAIENIEKLLWENKEMLLAQSNNELEQIYITDFIQTIIILLSLLLLGMVLSANEKQKKLVAELKQLNATKDKFFSIISHDLKNPFNSILGFSELLEKNFEKYPVEKTKQFIINIHQTAKKTFELLENLLEWSRLETGKVKPTLQSVKLEEIISDEIELLNCAATQKYITLMSDCPADLIVFADKNMVRTVLRNLISNAIKFTEINGIVEVAAEENHKFVSVSVNDNGIGIVKDNLENLFKIDKETSTLGTQGEKGTGLGLLLCKELVELNKGKIEVESEIGVGSKFKVKLPKYIEKTEAKTKLIGNLHLLIAFLFPLMNKIFFYVKIFIILANFLTRIILSM